MKTRTYVLVTGSGIEGLAFALKASKSGAGVLDSD